MDNEKAYITDGKALKAEDVPPVFGPEDRWSVQDEYGNIYDMKKNPHHIFLKKNGKEMELHLIYSTDIQSILKGQNQPKKDPF